MIPGEGYLRPMHYQSFGAAIQARNACSMRRLVLLYKHKTHAWFDAAIQARNACSMRRLVLLYKHETHVACRRCSSTARLAASERRLLRRLQGTSAVACAAVVALLAGAAVGWLRLCRLRLQLLASTASGSTTECCALCAAFALYAVQAACESTCGTTLFSLKSEKDYAKIGEGLRQNGTRSSSQVANP